MLPQTTLVFANSFTSPITFPETSSQNNKDLELPKPNLKELINTTKASSSSPRNVPPPLYNQDGAGPQAPQTPQANKSSLKPRNLYRREAESLVWSKSKQKTELDLPLRLGAVDLERTSILRLQAIYLSKMRLLAIPKPNRHQNLPGNQ